MPRRIKPRRGFAACISEGFCPCVVFIPNRLAHTKEQRDGLAELQAVLAEQSRGRLVSGLSNRPAVYPPVFNGRKDNLFHTKLDQSAEAELRQLFECILES